MGFLILWQTPVSLGGKKDALAPFATAEDLVTAVLHFAADDELPAHVLCGGAAEVAHVYGGPGAVAEAEDALCAGDGAVAAPPPPEEALLAGVAASSS